MDDTRQLFQQLTRRFGLLNKYCCSVGGQEISLVHSQILYEIDHQHLPSMQQIATTLGVDNTAFSHQIQTLIKKKLVKKSVSDLDKRVFILSLTTEGKFIATVIDQQVREYLNQIFSGMSELEKETIIKAMTLLNGNMEKVPACCG